MKRGLTESHVNALALTPGDGATLYAGTEPGLFRSTDGGATWHFRIVWSIKDEADRQPGGELANWTFLTWAPAFIGTFTGTVHWLPPPEPLELASASFPTGRNR